MIIRVVGAHVRAARAPRRRCGRPDVLVAHGAEEQRLRLAPRARRRGRSSLTVGDALGGDDEPGRRALDEELGHAHRLRTAAAALRLACPGASAWAPWSCPSPSSRSRPWSVVGAAPVGVLGVETLSSSSAAAVGQDRDDEDDRREGDAREQQRAARAGTTGRPRPALGGLGWRAASSGRLAAPRAGASRPGGLRGRRRRGPPSAGAPAAGAGRRGRRRRRGLGQGSPAGMVGTAPAASGRRSSAGARAQTAGADSSRSPRPRAILAEQVVDDLDAVLGVELAGGALSVSAPSRARARTSARAHLQEVASCAVGPSLAQDELKDRSLIGRQGVEGGHRPGEP